ncbi:MAG: DUF5681 domain-containing protein [Phycisphaeraceae bacterium]
MAKTTNKTKAKRTAKRKAKSKDGRNTRGRWTPGVSGNPAGRPPGKRRSALLRDMAGDPHKGGITRGAALACLIWAKALAGDRYCIGLIFDRVEGRAMTAEEAKALESMDDSPIRLPAGGPWDLNDDTTPET